MYARISEFCVKAKKLEVKIVGVILTQNLNSPHNLSPQEVSTSEDA